MISNFIEKLSYQRGLQASNLRVIATAVESMIGFHMKEANGFFTQMDYNMPIDSYNF